MKKLFYIVLGFSLLISCTKETALETLEAPIALAPNVLSSNSFEPKWESAANAQKYVVEISLNNAFSPIERSVTFGPSNPIENLESNTQYYYRLSAIASNFSPSPFSNTIDFFTLPDWPVIRDFTNITSSGFTGNWEAISGINTYVIYVSEGERSYGPVLIHPQYNGIEVSKNTIDIEGLDSGKLYFFWVQSKNQSGLSELRNREIQIP